MSARLVLLLVACFALVSATAGDRSLSDPRVSLRGRGVTVRTALDTIRRQTGVAVQDLGSAPDRPIDLDLDKVPVWQAIDTVARLARTRAVVSGKELVIRLLPPSDAPDSAPVCYDGPFRVRLVRVTSNRDFDADRRTTIVGLELTWLPTLRPLFLDSIAHDVRLRDAKGRSEPLPPEGSSLVAVEGRSSFPLDLALPGFARSSSVISALEGLIPAVVPSKFLTFRFQPDLAALHSALPGGAVRQLAQDDVTCRIDRVLLTRDRWSIRVDLGYPPGGKQLESFQAGSLVAQNEMVLASRDGKRTLRPSGYAIDEVGSRRARVTYHFTTRPGVPFPAPRDLTVEYTAPARIIDAKVRFAFRDVPLP